MAGAPCPAPSLLRSTRLLFAPADFRAHADLCDDPVAWLATDDVLDLRIHVLVRCRNEIVSGFGPDSLVLRDGQLHWLSALPISAFADPLGERRLSQQPLGFDVFVVSAEEDLV